jgi:hypothetical protein
MLAADSDRVEASKSGGGRTFGAAGVLGGVRIEVDVLD